MRPRGSTYALLALAGLAAACESSTSPRDAGGSDAASATGGAGGVAPSDAAAGGSNSGPAVDEVDRCGTNDACRSRRYATWPMPNPPSTPLPNPGLFRVTNDAAVDLVTGLEWQRAFTDKISWADARATCDALVLAGRDDWRLPTRIELVSLVDFTTRPTAFGGAFGDTPEDYFWSATPVVPVAGHAFSVYFGAGLTAFGHVEGPSAHARCVRGGRVVSSERWRIQGDEVLDLNTGLRWQRRHHPDRLAHEAALTLCTSLRLGGGDGSGWRLPSSKEAQTLVDDTRGNPAVDASAFPETPSGRFWTSTATNKGGLESAIYLDTADGQTEEEPATNPLWVRCVR